MNTNNPIFKPVSPNQYLVLFRKDDILKKSIEYYFNKTIRFGQLRK